MTIRRSALALTLAAGLVLALPDSPRPAANTYPGKKGLIAFSRFVPGTQPQILVMSEKVGSERQLIANASEPSWSPNGKRLAFTRATPDGHQGLFVAEATGEGARRLTWNVSTPDEPVLDSHPRWTLDGRRLLFHRFENDRYDLYVMNTDGRGRRKLGSGFVATWSPDGRRIAFADHARQGIAFDIFVMDANGGNRRRLTTFHASDSEPDWSPDGRRIVFVRELAGRNLEIYSIRADGRDQRRLTHLQADDFSPVWSPDGRSIVFASRRAAQRWDLYVMRPDGTGQRRLTYALDDDVQPSWQRRP